MSITRHEVGPRMSRVVEHNGTVYLAGLTADDHAAGITTQTTQILNKIDNYLETAGTNKSKLLSAQLWISDMALFADMNAVWDAWIDPTNPPVRACVQSPLARPEILLEIKVIAAK